jgi:protein-S-isoprenylcysteine O-methyltransferase Ste14
MKVAAWVIRVSIMYFPMIAAVLAWIVHGRRPRQFAACLLSLLWAMTSLAAVQRLNEWAGWWSFPSGGGMILLCGMPLELYIGWVLLWGVLPQLVFPRLAIGWCVVIMVIVDLVAMPQFLVVVLAQRLWLVGEAVAVLFVLIPALCIARWTLEDSHLRMRAAMQAILAGMLFLFFIPEMIFALRPGRGWAPLLELPGWRRNFEIQLLFLMAIPGLGAVMEFAERGLGTPIPYDPPKRLVVSGIYRYCANPMQLSCGLVMLFWAALLQNGWLALGAVLSLVYSAGIAEWDESLDLARRFGNYWQDYRAAVHNWRLRWRPYHAGPEAKLYIAHTCRPCSEVRSWLESKDPLGLALIGAETLPAGSIQRMRYDPNDGSNSVEGIRAFGRALEHLHLGWALCGATLRLPGVWQSVQLLMDASGLGPRLLGDVL